MKKRYWLAGGFALTGAAAVAAHRLVRPQALDWQVHAERVHHADRSRFVTVDGVRIHYQEAGDVAAPALILVHGFLVSNFVWRDVLVPLAEQGFRVIAPDLVGFGFSEKPAAAEYTVEAQARMLVGLLDELQIARAAFVGSSYGGAISTIVALEHPARVTRLVLVGAVCNDNLKRHPLLRLVATPAVGDVLSPPLLDLRYFLRRKLSRFDRAAHGDRVRAMQRIAGRHLPLRAADTQRAMLSTLRRWSATRVERDAHLLQPPTLLVWGENDLDTPLRDGETLHKLIPNSRLLVFPGVGHLPQEEIPQAFTEVVAEFLKPVTSAE
ncbi:MAG TPA: alpha/beta hydrolase [Pyrinomonadaceae bacterium]|jgi:pimeloyl-ACP methyl ester carboxylesterase